MNKKGTLNDNWSHHSTRFIEVEDPCSNNGFGSISKLLRVVLHKMLCTLAVITSIIKLVVGTVTMTSTTVLTYVGSQRRVVWRRRQWLSRNDSRSRPRLFVTMTLINLLHLLLMFSPDIVDISVLGSKEFLD